MTENTPNAAGSSPRSKGAALFYLVAVLATGVSIDTSWRFFGVRLNIPNTLFGQPPLFGFIGERFVLFAVLELTMLACGVAMRANARRAGGKQGATQILAWALCALSGYMAVDLAGVVEGFARVVLGPVLGLIALHLALGIEVKVRRAANTGTWARIFAEYRERFLSRLGLGDDQRKAAERTRDRARERAARLATATGWVPWKDARLVRAVRASGATLDAAQRSKLLEEVAVLKNVTDLTAVDVESPWSTAVPAHVQRFVDAAKSSIEAQRAAADRDAAAILDEAQQAAAALHRAADEALRDAQRRSAALIAETAAARSAALSDAAKIRAAADAAAAQIRDAADDYRRDRESAALRQSEQVTAAARAEADRIRAAAQADAAALRSAADRAAAQQRTNPEPQRGDRRGEAPQSASAEALIDALAQQWPTEIPSLRAAAQHLRDRFGSCSDRRVADAVAALRAKRNGHRDAPDPERLQLTDKVNGNHPQLAGAASA